MSFLTFLLNKINSEEIQESIKNKIKVGENLNGEGYSKKLRIYQDQLRQKEIQKAYRALIKYVAEIKAKFPENYQTGNISLGYLDYTYFSFYNEELRRQKLRFGIVLNHEKLQFECWLMGQNAQIQKAYWEILKNTKWNQDQSKMPQYAVLEAVLETQIDFENKENMTKNIIDHAISFAEEVQMYLKNVQN